MRSALLLAVAVSSCSTYGTETPAAADGDAGDAAASTDGGADAGIEPVYVAPFGRDFAEGTAEAPVVTFARALALSAQRGGADIVACVGTYEENVVIERSVRVRGDRSCIGWAPSTERARIAPPVGVALKIAAAANVVVEGFEVVATADHTQPGSSAIGAFVTRSNGVVLRNVTITASGGIDGRDAAAPVPNWSGVVAIAASASGTTGAPGAKHVCADATSSLGGNGGAAPAGGGSIPTSGSAVPSVGAPNAGANASVCINGTSGAPGSPGKVGDALVFPFEVTSTAFVAKAGAPGGNGSPGQGGGGGGANTTGGGGAGGGGGCGGSGGAGATSGGSSIAVLAFESELVVEGSTLAAGEGANGGIGADAQAGQLGVGGGSGACFGGSGARGGAGAGGGGGAGGVSAAVFYVGTAPKLTTTIATAAKAGVGGAGGLADTEALAGKPGAPGKAGEVITF